MERKIAVQEFSTPTQKIVCILKGIVRGQKILEKYVKHLMKKIIFICLLFVMVFAFQNCTAPITPDEFFERNIKERKVEAITETNDASDMEKMPNISDETLIEENLTQEKNEPSYSEWPCEDIAKTFIQLYLEKNVCEQDEDCVLLGVKGGCDCLVMVYRGVFTSVPKKEEAFRLLHDRLFSVQCAPTVRCEFHFSRGPGFYRSKCENRRCKAVLLDGFHDGCF